VRASAERGLAELDAAAGDAPAAEARLERLRGAGLATPEDSRRLAELASLRGDPARAVDLLREAGGRPLLLAAALGGAARWAELVEHLDRAAEGASAAEARELLRRAGEVAERNLSDPARAAALYERASRLGADADLWFRLGRLQA